MVGREEKNWLKEWSALVADQLRSADDRYKGLTEKIESAKLGHINCREQVLDRINKMETQIAVQGVKIALFTSVITALAVVILKELVERFLK